VGNWKSSTEPSKQEKAAEKVAGGCNTLCTQLCMPGSHNYEYNFDYRRIEEGGLGNEPEQQQEQPELSW
jgi:hypothetical protein